MRFLKIFGIAFVTGLSGAMMPGPMLALVIGQTFARGFMAVLAIVLGHALLELVLVVLLMSGLRAVLLRHRVRGLIGLVGGAVLIWMGVDMVQQASALSLELAGSGQAAMSWGSLIIGGAAVCAINPYFLGWWATIGAGGLAHVAPRSRGEYLTFFVGHELSDLSWYGLVGLVIVTSRHILHGAVYQALVFACGVVILALAAWFIYTGLRFLLKKGGTTEERDQATPTA
ncbi:MAG: LysE family transporter [Armatimonadetes bacterium]|nr:LysE family transporter [Armatimonadota bacterium]